MAKARYGECKHEYTVNPETKAKCLWKHNRTALALQRVQWFREYLEADPEEMSKAIEDAGLMKFLGVMQEEEAIARSPTTGVSKILARPTEDQKEEMNADGEDQQQNNEELFGGGSGDY